MITLGRLPLLGEHPHPNTLNQIQNKLGSITIRQFTLCLPAVSLPAEQTLQSCQ